MHLARSRSAIATLLVWGFALLVASSASAQVLRPSESLYAQLRGGATFYSGDLTEDTFGEPGVAAGLEVGYLFSPSFSLGLGFVYHDLPIREGIRYDGTDFVTQEQSGLAYQFQGLARYSPFLGRVSPFVEVGGALVLGQGEESERNNGSSDDTVLGYGPVGGLGVDFALTQQLGFALGVQSTFVFPDVALDNADPGSFGADGDDSDFDALTTIYGGLRYAFRAPYTPVEVVRLDCPAEATQGEPVAFSVTTNAEATPPVSVSWTWGDGSTGAGRTASHTYRATGTYTVTATAIGDYNEDADTCVITVVEPQIPPTLSACRVAPTTVALGETVTLSGTVNSDATQPVSVAVTWGDGDGDSGTTLPSTHSYDEVGTYTVTATASNAYGSDSCTATVTVEDAFCAQVSELNSAYFEYGSSSLTADGIDRLEENLSLMRRCPDVCVLIRAYTDDRESDQLRLSQRRADAIRDYYVSQGIDISRLQAEGRGADPTADSKEDPGPGDSRARRADSIPASCGTFAPTGRSVR